MSPGSLERVQYKTIEKKLRNSSVQTNLVFAVVKNSKIGVSNILLKEVGDWQSTFVEGYSLLLHLTRPKTKVLFILQRQPFLFTCKQFFSL